MTRGLGRVFKRKLSQNWQIEYWYCGQQMRESSGSPREKVAADLLKKRLGEIGIIDDGFGLYALVALHHICEVYAKGDIFGKQMGAMYRKFGRGLLLLGAASGLYTALITTVLTYVPGTTHLAIPFGLSTADMYLMVVGVAVMMLGSVMDEAHRIQDENSTFI